MEKRVLTAAEENNCSELGMKENAVLRSIQIVDLVCDTATEFIVEFVDNQECPEAQALLSQPEILGFRAVEAALRHWLNGGRRQEQPVH